jgi:hypothetical protein
MLKLFLLTYFGACASTTFATADRESVHLVKLDKLLDICALYYEDLTPELLLGVAIANGEWKSFRKCVSNQ